MASIIKPKMGTGIAFPFQIKSLDTQGHTFEGLAATWTRDLGSDIIQEGAFKRTIQHWKKGKKVHPLIDMHNYGTIRSVVGKLMDASETKDGVEGKWEVIDGPDGDEVMRRLEGKYVDSLSIGYRPVKYEFVKNPDSPYGQDRLIKELEWRETSLVLFPMNPEALIDLSTVKSQLAEIKSRLEGELSAEDRAELEELDRDIQALLSKSPAGDAGTEETGLADDDPSILAAQDRLRIVTLRALGN